MIDNAKRYVPFTYKRNAIYSINLLFLIKTYSNIKNYQICMKQKRELNRYLTFLFWKTDKCVPVSYNVIKNVSNV